MKDRAVVLPGGGQCQKVKGRAWASVAKDFAFDIADGGVNGDGHADDNNMMGRFCAASRL